MYNSEGFEPLDDYTIGNTLQGEDPDDNTEPDNLEGPWLQSIDTDPGVAATIASTAGIPGSNGAQVVEVTHSVSGDGGFWGVLTPAFGVDHVTLSWRMLVEDSDPGDTGGVGPFFGMDIYDDNANDPGFPVLLAATVGLDSATGELVTFDQFLDEVRTGTFLDLGEWLDFQMVLDYATQTFDVSVDGVLLIDDQLFIDGGFGPAPSGDIDDVTDFAISTFALDDTASGAFTPSSATAYYDDIVIAIPEPSTTAIVIAGLVGIGLKRRRYNKSVA